MDFGDIFADLNLPVSHKGFEVVPEAPVTSDLLDLDSLFGAGDSLSELRPSQWLPVTQHQRPPHCETITSVRECYTGDENHHKDTDIEQVVSERGDSQEIYLGSQFPIVKKVKTAKVKVQSIPKKPYEEIQQDVHSVQKNFRNKSPKSNRIFPQNRQDHDIGNFFQTPAALVLPSTKKRQGMCLKSVLEYFNIVQSKVFDDVLYTDRSIVVCSPTGSGKTAIFEMAIIRLLTNTGTTFNKSFKVVYMAPIKALCSERYQDWQRKFEPLGLKVMELTGDTDLEDFYLLQEVNIILTTPEKWDSMTRKWRDNKSVVQAIYLFLVDEIHILNDETRGATVEAVISRMKTIQAARSRSSKKDDCHDFRFVAVSATLTNIEDIAAWLGTGRNQALHHKFDESHRPVRLRKVVMGYNFSEKQSSFQFEISLNYKLAGIINTYSEGKPTLVFCSTRKSVTQGADILAKDMKSSFIRSGQHRQLLQNLSYHIKDSKLRDLLTKGIGYHHAGMDFQDRKNVEETFANGDLSVLVATSTLAMGVNLPAHLVIIKSTMYYNMGCHEEYSDTQILQMIGRAGRPQFDTSATAVIMTKNQTRGKYDMLINGSQHIESNLHKNLIEHLNAEIVLGTITDISVAVEWLKFTYLYIRVMKNPKYYGMPAGLTQNSMEKRLQELCMKNLNQLLGLNLIQMNGDTLDVKPTENGRVMARYCISYKTAELFNSIKDEETIADLLLIMSKCQEFEDIKLRINEKKTLNTLNKDKNRATIRYPLPGKIKTADMKVNCLIQAQLGCLLVQDFALQQDTSRIFRVGIRVTRCLVEFLSQRGSNHRTLLSALQLCKAFKARLWENSKFVSKQLEGIGPSLSNALVNSGLSSFEKIEQTNPREIELIVNRHPPFGNQVRDSVMALPRYELVIEQIARYYENRAEIVISLQMSNRDQLKDKPSTGHTCTLLVGDQDNRIIFKQRIMDSLLLRETIWSRKIEVHRANKGPELLIHYISQDRVGMDIECSYIPHFIGGVRISNSATSDETTGITDKDKNQPKPRKRQSKAEAVEPKPKPTSTRAVANHINDMKSRLSNFPATPTLFKKRCLEFTAQDNRNTPGDLSKYAYTRKPRYGHSSEGCYQFNQALDVNEMVEDNGDISYEVPLDWPIMRASNDQMLPEQANKFQRPNNFKKNNDWAELDMYQKHREVCRIEEAQQEYVEDDSLPDLDFNNGVIDKTGNRAATNIYEQSTLHPDFDIYTNPLGPDMQQETDYGFVYVGGDDPSHTLDWDDRVTQDLNMAQSVQARNKSKSKLYAKRNIGVDVQQNSADKKILQDETGGEFIDNSLIECYESDDEDQLNQQSKWASYFSSQSSTASDYLKSKYPARHHSKKLFMEDSRHSDRDYCQRDVRKSVADGLKCGKNVSKEDDRLLPISVKQSSNNQQPHKYGQVLAWISNSEGNGFTPKQNEDLEFENWSDEDNVIEICEKQNTCTSNTKARSEGRHDRKYGEVFTKPVRDNNACMMDDNSLSLQTSIREKNVEDSQPIPCKQTDKKKTNLSRFFPSVMDIETDNDFTSIFDGLF